MFNWLSIGSSLRVEVVNFELMIIINMGYNWVVSFCMALAAICQLKLELSLVSIQAEIHTLKSHLGGVRRVSLTLDFQGG